ncbi:MAG: sensor histidine kinase [Phycisphaerales bacterium]
MPTVDLPAMPEVRDQDPSSATSAATGSAADGSNVPAAADPINRLADLERQLQHTQRLAALGTIAGLIAHEFNNLLTPVMTYAQLALENPGDQALATKALERAAAGSQRAAEIASAILGFSRDDFDVPRGTSSASADVAAAVRGALSCLARDPVKDGIALDIAIEHPATGPLRTAMRPVALQQVLLNLILNARRAMNGQRAGSLTVNGQLVIVGGHGAQNQGNVVSTAPRAASLPDGSAHASPFSIPADALICESRPIPAGVLCHITIEDSGCGIARDRLATIFAPHVSHNATGAAGSGFGLGLAICSRLIDETGGVLYVRSTIGQGTTMGLLIPAA